MNIEKRCNHYTLIVACMLSGASQDRPVIVGWSTPPRGQVIQESLGQVPKKLAAGPRVLARTESSRTQSGTRPGGPPHDHWAKLGQLRYTRSQYAFVVMHFSRWNSSRRPSRKKGEPVRSNGDREPDYSQLHHLYRRPGSKCAAGASNQLGPRDSRESARVLDFASSYKSPATYRSIEPEAKRRNSRAAADHLSNSGGLRR